LVVAFFNMTDHTGLTVANVVLFILVYGR